MAEYGAEYVELNRANWDDRVHAHFASADYGVQRFLDDPVFLSDVVFETAEARVSDYAGTYVRTDPVIEHTVTHWWNHGIGETVTALLEAGLTLTGLAEHDTVPWRQFPGKNHRQALVTSGTADASPKTQA